MKLGSIYSGAIDAFAYAANNLGIEVAWHIEKERQAHRYLKQNYPNAKIYDFDENCGKRNLEWVDIIAGGDPCQPNSSCGKRLGQADDRYRWPQMFRIISELRPNWVINENVAGSICNMVFDKKITDLESIGYTWGAYNIPAVSVGGHHQRQRVFIIATNTNGEGWRELLHIDPSAIFEKSGENYSLGAQGNAFLQFQQSEAEPALFPVAYGIPDQVFRLEAAGNSIASPIPLILLTAIKTISYGKIHASIR